MKTLQPAYFALANLGDVHPFEHGGAFVLVDRRGIYDPQLWVWEPDRYEEENAPGTLYTLDIPRCHVTAPGGDEWNENVEVGSNRFHPTSAEWFGNSARLQSAADTSGMEKRELVKLLCASDPIERAEGYRVVYSNFGLHEFDQYPQTFTKAREARAMINRLSRQVSTAAKWSDGLA